MDATEIPNQPRGELVTRTVAMPKDTNPNGDIFGGWLMSQMDLGSGILASKMAKTRVVTAALDGMSFLQPVRVGDTVACYARVESIGRTSMKIPVEVWVQRYMRTEQLLVTRAVFTYVAIDQTGNRSRSSATEDLLGGYCPLASPLPSPIDSGPEASLVMTGSVGCMTGMVFFSFEKKRFCCLARPALILCT